MPIAPTQDILQHAFRERYGVAAINIVNDLSLEAVLAAAEELRAPLIVQTSVKTVKMEGADVLYAMWVEMTRHITVPVALHLDHCPDREVISTCLAKGWNSVLFDASKLSVEENRRQCIEVVAEARRYGAAVEGEIEGIKGVEDDIGSNAASPVQSLDVALDFIRSTGIDCFAPAIGNAHGAVPDDPHPGRPARQRHRGGRADPDRPPRWDGDGTGAVQRPHRPWLRQGQHLDGAQDPVHAVGLRPHDGAPR